jgi:hypothetical protein
MQSNIAIHLICHRREPVSVDASCSQVMAGVGRALRMIQTERLSSMNFFADLT